MTDSRITAQVTVFEAVTVRDITPGGVQIDARFPLQNDSLHEFRLTLRERSVVVKGRIVRCEVAELQEAAVTYRWHVEFVELPPHAVPVIQDFVADHRALPVIDGDVC